MKDSINKGPLKAAAEWETFEDSLRQGISVNEEFVSRLVQSSLSCVFEMKAGVPIFRARRMPVKDQSSTEPLPLHKMGAPPDKEAEDGRLSPKGTAIFYGALDPETALAEVRPWERLRVSIAEFRTATPIKVLDLTGDGVHQSSDESVSWAGFMITRPVHWHDEGAYLSFQFLASKWRSKGIQGVLFDSALYPNGWNLALFDPDVVKARTVELREVFAVSYEWAQMVPPETAFDFMKPPYPRGFLEG